VYFEGRQLTEYAEPVSSHDLREGQLYFAVNYIDDEMLIPTMETVVFIGRNLEPGDVGQVYFQDVESHREGVSFDPNTDDGAARFQCGSEDELGHIFDYEHALEELMRCSLRHKQRGQLD